MGWPLSVRALPGKRSQSARRNTIQAGAADHCFLGANGLGHFLGLSDASQSLATSRIVNRDAAPLDRDGSPGMASTRNHHDGSTIHGC